MKREYKEYIEREVISEGIRKCYYKNPPNSSYQEGFDRGLDKAQRVILDAPAADVVEVVRCRECKYWGDEAGELQRSDRGYSRDAKYTTICLMGDILGGVQRKMISVPTEKGKEVLIDG